MFSTELPSSGDYTLSWSSLEPALPFFFFVVASTAGFSLGCIPRAWICVFRYKFPTIKRAQDAAALVEDGERLLEEVQAARRDALAAREKQRNIVEDTLAGVVRVAEGAVRSAGSAGIDSAELCQLEDMIFSATSEAITTGTLPENSADSDDTEPTNGRTGIRGLLERLRDVRKGVQAALRQREEQSRASQKERVRGAEAELEFTKSELAREIEEAMKAAKAAANTKQQQALERLERFLGYCNLDRLKTALGLDKDAGRSDAVDGGNITFSRPRTARMLLGKELAQSISDGVPPNDPVAQEAQRRCEFLDNFINMEGNARLRTLKADTTAFEVATKRIESLSEEKEDQTNPDASRLGSVRDAVAAARTLQSSLDAFLPFMSVDGKDDQRDVLAVEHARAALREGLDCLASTMVQEATKATALAAAAALVPKLQLELSKAKVRGDAELQAKEEAAQQVRTGLQREEELQAKLREAEKSAAAEVERLQSEVDAREGLLREERETRVEAERRLKDVAAAKVAAEDEAAAAEAAMAAAQEQKEAEDKAAEREANDRLRECHMTVASAVQAAKNRADALLERRAKTHGENCPTRDSDQVTSEIGPIGDAAQAAALQLRAHEDGIARLEAELSRAQSANCTDGNETILNAEAYLKELRKAQRDFKVEVENARVRLRQDLELLRRHGRSLLSECRDEHPAGSSTTAGVIVEDFGSLQSADPHTADDVDAHSNNDEGDEGATTAFGSNSPADSTQELNDTSLDSNDETETRGQTQAKAGGEPTLAHAEVFASRISRLQAFEANVDGLLSACAGVLDDADPLSSDAARISDAKRLQREAHDLALKLSAQEVQRLTAEAAFEAAATKAALAADKTAALQAEADARDAEIKAMRAAHEDALAAAQAATEAEQAKMAAALKSTERQAEADLEAANQARIAAEAAAKEALREMEAKSVAEKAAAARKARVRANELMEAAVAQAEAEVEWAKSNAEKWKQRAGVKEAEGFAGDGIHGVTGGEQTPIVDAVSAYREAQSSGKPIPVDQLLLPTNADREKVATIVDDYAMVGDCASRLTAIAGSEAVGAAVEADDADAELAARAKRLQDSAKELGEWYGGLAEERQAYYETWLAHGDASAERCRELLRQVLQELKQSETEADAVLQDVLTQLAEDSDSDDGTDFEPAEAMRRALQENRDQQRLVELLLSNSADEGQQVSPQDLLAGIRAVVASTASVLGASEDPEADHVRRDVVNGLLAKLTGGHSAENSVASAALADSVRRGRRLEAKVTGMAQTMDHEAQELERTLALLAGDESDAVSEQSNVEEDDAGLSDEAKAAAEDVRRLQAEYDALQEEIREHQKEFEAMESTIGLFEVCASG